MTIRINLLWIFLCSRLVCSGEKNATIVRIETIRNLQAGEEITVCYSENYFYDNNKNCRCFSCRAQQYIESEECPKSLPNLFGSSTPTGFAISPASTPSTNSDQETEGREETGNSGELCNGEEPCNSEELSEPKHDQGETEELKSHKREKKVKTDSRVECFVCHSVVSRMDRHILQHSDFLDEKLQKFSLDFYRTKNATKTKSIYDCKTCFRRFASLETHKFINKCASENVTKVENHWSRSSLPMEIRMAFKSKVLPTARELEIAQRFVD